MVFSEILTNKTVVGGGLIGRAEACRGNVSTYLQQAGGGAHM